MSIRQLSPKLEDILFDVVVYVGVTFAAIITLYPFIYVISMSISDPVSVAKNEVWLWPKGFSLLAYRRVFNNPLVLRGYYNTIWYTVVGTSLNIIFTSMAAYPLSKQRFFARNFFTFVFVFTMFFGGGLIPFFILIGRLGIYNTRLAIVIPGLISTWNMVICRTFFQTLPEELFESARIDGCKEFRIMSTILLPLSKPIIAVLALFYGIGHWNAWFNALLFLPDSTLHPIQIFLRRVVIQGSMELMEQHLEQTRGQILSMLQVKYAVIIVASLPIITLYPFLQKYFVKGVLIGSLKG